MTHDEIEEILHHHSEIQHELVELCCFTNKNDGKVISNRTDNKVFS